MDRLKKASKIELASTFSDSKVIGQTDSIPTAVPALNIAFSGDIHGGVAPGLTMFAGESRSFKTLFSMLCAKAYLDKYDDAVLIFYDSEMGASKDYFNSLEIDMDRVFHVPITNIEELKFDIMSQLQELKRGDHAIIVIDSIGNLASAKEIDDAINEKSAADMTRAKQLKSLTRMITPYLNILNIPMIMVNHIYMEIGMFPKAITSGGCVEKGTQIIMSDNTLKCIEDVEVGDMVKTMDGNFKVTHTWNPNTLENGTPECYKVTFEDGTTVVCSDIHRFRKNGKWEYIANMAVGDDVDTLAE